MVHKRTDEEGTSSRIPDIFPRKSRTSRVFVGMVKDRIQEEEKDDIINQEQLESRKVEDQGQVEEIAAEDSRKVDEGVKVEEGAEGGNQEQVAQDSRNRPNKNQSKKSWFKADTYRKAEETMIDLLWKLSGENYGIPVNRSFLNAEALKIKGMKNTALVSSLLTDMVNKVYGGKKFIKAYNQTDGTMFFSLEGPHGQGRLMNCNELKDANLLLQKKIMELEDRLKETQNYSVSGYADIPICVVTDASNLPIRFLAPSISAKLVVGFACEGMDLGRNGRISIITVLFSDCIYLIDVIKGGKELVESCKPALESVYITKIIHDCKRDSEVLYYQFGIKLQKVIDTQIAYRMIEEQEGRRGSHAYSTLKTLLADPHYCGTSEKEEEVGSFLEKDPTFWMHRPLSVLMIRAAAYRVRFLLQIYQRMIKKLSEKSLWKLLVRGSFRCMCFCLSDKKHDDWPCVPSFPDSLVSQGHIPQKEILIVLGSASGEIERFIKEIDNFIGDMWEKNQVEIVDCGSKGPHDKLFLIGPVEEMDEVEIAITAKIPSVHRELVI